MDKINYLGATFLFPQLSGYKIIMKKNFLIASLAWLFIFSACSKSTAVKDKEVSIRIQNSTTANFTNFNFNGADFGSINAGDSTDYQTFQKIIPYTFGNSITINNEPVYGGLFFTDFLPNVYLESGKYTLQLFDDTLPYAPVNARFIKE